MRNMLMLLLISLFLAGPLMGQARNEGVRIDDALLKQHQFKSSATLTKIASLPVSVDLSAFAPTSIDQGLQGSCAAQAVAGVAGMEENLLYGYSSNYQFSPSFLFNQVNFGGTGSTVENNLELVCEEGVPKLSVFPYNDKDYATLPSIDVVKSALPHRAYNWSYFLGGDTLPTPTDGSSQQTTPGFLGVNTARGILASGHPVVLVIVPTNNTNEDTLGAEGWVFSWFTQKNAQMSTEHAVYVIGYNDTLSTKDGKGAFRIRMSSGPNHWDHGDLWVTYQAVGLWQMGNFYTLTPRVEYKPEFTVSTQISNFGGLQNMSAGIKINGQVYSQRIWRYRSNNPTQLYSFNCIVDLTDLLKSADVSKGGTLFLQGTWRPSQWLVGNPIFTSLHIIDSAKHIDTIIDANLVIKDSVWYAEWTFKPDIASGVTRDPFTTPANYALTQNYPNPFNPTTTIDFSIVKSGKVTLKVYNLLGQEVTTLVDNYLSTGAYHTKLDASKLASGVYVYRLQTDTFTATKKMVLMK